jgi:hypothetical protein
MRRGVGSCVGLGAAMVRIASDAGAEGACRQTCACVAGMLGLELPRAWRARRPDARISKAVAALGTDELRDPSRVIGAGLEAVLESQRGERGSSHARKRSGAYYTPDWLVQHILDTALSPSLERGTFVSVLDPACGSGVFLVAALRRMSRRLGTDPQKLAGSISGVDLSAAAAAIAHFAIWLECAGRVDPELLQQNIRVGDALLDERLAAGRFGVVVGNPPFLNQLETSTAHGTHRASLLRAKYGPAARCYADTASIFLELAARVTAPGGRVAMVQPQSFLSARDAEPVRRSLMDRGTLTHLWVAQEKVFGANVMVCVPTVRIGRPRAAEVHVAVGAGFEPLSQPPGSVVRPGSWAPLIAAVYGIPHFKLNTADAIGDHATATADFRDQFYGLRGRIVDDADLPANADRLAYPPLITTGLVDPAACVWGHRSPKIDGRHWDAPRLNLKLLNEDPELARWARTRLTPKILLATQTRVLEAVVDEPGEWVPVTPLITVVPRRPEGLWHIGAALSSPVLTAWALREFAGAGLSASAIKLSARQVLALPAPAEGPQWDRGAVLFRAASQATLDDDRLRLLHDCAGVMCTAYGLDDKAAGRLTPWWRERLHARRAKPPASRFALAT